MTTREECCCADPGCAAHYGVSGCESESVMSLSRIDMTPGVYDLPMCAPCAADALESGLFASR